MHIDIGVLSVDDAALAFRGGSPDRPKGRALVRGVGRCGRETSLLGILDISSDITSFPVFSERRNRREARGSLPLRSCKRGRGEEAEHKARRLRGALTCRRIFNVMCDAESTALGGGGGKVFLPAGV